MNTPPTEPIATPIQTNGRTDDPLQQSKGVNQLLTGERPSQFDSTPRYRSGQPAKNGEFVVGRAAKGVVVAGVIHSIGKVDALGAGAYVTIPVYGGVKDVSVATHHCYPAEEGLLTLDCSITEIPPFGWKLFEKTRGTLA